MRRATRLFLLVAILAVPLSGCVSKAEHDMFAYTRQPLFASTFYVDASEEVDVKQFRVEDGSIFQLQFQVWVNMTAGAAHVEVVDPQGRVAITTTESVDRMLMVELGVWEVRVKSDDGQPAEGQVGVLVTRG